MKNYTVKLSVSRLEKENIIVEDSFDSGFLEIDENDIISVVAPVSFKFEAQLYANGIVIRGRAATRIAGECGRCLVPVEEDISTEYTIMLDELGSADEIDVSEEIREEILLAFPANILCSLDCKGLCPECGVNLNKKSCKCHETAPKAPSPWDALDQLS